MNYLQAYNSLVESRKTRKIEDGVYYEKHHIVPRCMGGTDDANNLVELTPREHYIAHLLLWKSNPNNIKLYWPLQWFYDKDGVRIPSRIIQIIKEDRSRFVALRDYNWTRSLEHRTKMSLISRSLNRDYTSWRTSNFCKEVSKNVAAQYSSGARVKKPKNATTGRYDSKPVVADGVHYPSISAAAKDHNISVKAALNRVQKETWPNWTYANSGLLQ